jgi:hypothetical protein
MTVGPTLPQRDAAAPRTRTNRGDGTGTGRGWIRSADRGGIWEDELPDTPAMPAANIAIQTRRSGRASGAGS